MAAPLYPAVATRDYRREPQPAGGEAIGQSASVPGPHSTFHFARAVQSKWPTSLQMPAIVTNHHGPISVGSTREFTGLKTLTARLDEALTTGLFTRRTLLCFPQSIMSVLPLFPTNYGQSAWNSVKVQPISKDRTPNHARTAAEMLNRRNCLHYFRTACTAA